jgi:lipopolysaccharide transport system ATP-binding protein
MSDVVIKVENVGKQYHLGKVGTGTIANDLNRWWHIALGKEDPYLKIGDTNDRTQKSSNNDIVWAIKDINFEVKQGEVLGIIGKNGAGKSTLLKILSRVTSPTIGDIKVKGRIASLLEVGTGFHPDLSGRENIFLNGAILGMTKQEIKSKFDEIVDFSGVERYIDTPVKRYSSGMYVRLAFAVAAHLEPEILIVDEVLAVGDSEFQKKCLGKMKDVAGQGRTVLFVSHNMTAVNSLCSKCVYLKNGMVVSMGETASIVNQYLSNENTNKTFVQWEKGSEPGDDIAILLWARLIDEDSNKIEFASIHKKIGIEYSYEVKKEGYCPLPNIHVYTSKGEIAFVSGESQDLKFSKIGVYKTTMWIPSNLLNEGTYIIRVALSTMIPLKVHFWDNDTLIFDVIEDLKNRNSEYNQWIPGVVRPKLDWETILITSQI